MNSLSLVIICKLGFSSPPDQWRKVCIWTRICGWNSCFAIWPLPQKNKKKKHRKDSLLWKGNDTFLYCCVIDRIIICIFRSIEAKRYLRLSRQLHPPPLEVSSWNVSSPHLCSMSLSWKWICGWSFVCLRKTLDTNNYLRDTNNYSLDTNYYSPSAWSTRQTSFLLLSFINFCPAKALILFLRT